jgi:hypothetical protein
MTSIFIVHWYNCEEIEMGAEVFSFFSDACIFLRGKIAINNPSVTEKYVIHEGELVEDEMMFPWSYMVNEDQFWAFLCLELLLQR